MTDVSGRKKKESVVFVWKVESLLAEREGSYGSHLSRWSFPGDKSIEKFSLAPVGQKEESHSRGGGVFFLTGISKEKVVLRRKVLS